MKRFLYLIVATMLTSYAFAQGTAFVYQGLLDLNGSPVSGSNDLTFTLFTASSGGATVGTSNEFDGLNLSNGVLTVTLDYGAGIFNGSPRWLQIAARPTSGGSFTNLSPRQQIVPVPYAIFAGSSSNLSGTVAATGLSGAYANGITLSNAANVLKGTFTGNGANVSNVNALTLGGINAAGFWQTGGNNSSPGDILGSVDNQVVQLVANGFNALRLEPNSMALPNVIGGNNNSDDPGVYAVVIAGGFGNSISGGATESAIVGGSSQIIASNAFNSIIGGGNNNKILTNASTSVIAGGESHIIDTNSTHSFIGGGLQNWLQGNTSFSTIGGGNGNIIQVSANYATICGGKSNTNGTTTAVIAGGESNFVKPGADRSFIGGGLDNVTTGALGMVPGGFANSAASQSFAAGRRAKANASGEFVWADSTDSDFNVSTINQVAMRATGGYVLFSNSGLTAGVTLTAGTSAWGTVCDRNAKKNFAPTDGISILEKLCNIPVQRWNYRWETDDSTPNLGPMAQDFKAAFYPGRDNKVITTLEFDGVELAAIQGLNEKLEAEAQVKDAEIGDLKQKVEQLTALMQSLTDKVNNSAK